MHLVINLLAGLVLSTILVKSTDWIITSSSRLAKHFKISQYTISFLVIAFATSLPELVVGIVSALEGNPALSYGNVLGSNIADLTIILAIPIFIGGAINTREMVKNKDLFFTVFFGILPLILIFDGTLSQADGIILIFSYLFYLALVLRRSSAVENIMEHFQKTYVLRDSLIFLFSILVLLGSADLLVKVAQNISYIAKVPLILIGLTVTALGTSLPELAFGLKAIKTHHKGEVLGNIVGSVIANSTLVLGVTAVISPIGKDGGVGLSSVAFLLATLFMFLIFSLSRKSIGKFEAFLLLLLYFVFVLVEKLIAS